jgi:cyd operon protein YbgT
LWYFTWILGLGFALAFGIINAMWFEVQEAGMGSHEQASDERSAPPESAKTG